MEDCTAKTRLLLVGGNNGLFDMRNPTLIAAMTKVFSADNLAAAAAHSWL